MAKRHSKITKTRNGDGVSPLPTSKKPTTKMQNALAQKQNRWQRFIHYVWDRKPGR
jgi:hypothetical protein